MTYLHFCLVLARHSVSPADYASLVHNFRVRLDLGRSALIRSFE